MVVRRKKKRRLWKRGGGKRRGAGSRGGRGRAGAGKRAAHRELMFERKREKGFFRFARLRKEMRSINVEGLESIARSIGTEIDLSELGYDKLIGKGRISIPVKVKVRACSKKAMEKIKLAGGEVHVVA